MRKLVMAMAVWIGLLFVCAGTGYADTPIRLYLDSKQLKPEIPPQIMNGSTMVPVRIISEELGAKVSWNQQEQMVSVEKSGMLIQLRINKTSVQVNGVPHMLEAAPALVEGNTLLPVRFISERLGLKVEWDDLTRSVSLYNTGEAVPAFGQNPDAPENSPVPAGVTPTPGPTATGSPLPGPSATPKPGGTSKPSTSGKIEVRHIDLEGDVLKVKMEGGSVQPKLLPLHNPERLIVDLPNAVLGETINGQPAVQNGVIASKNPYISQIRYALFQDDPSIVRIVVDLKQKIEYNLLESSNPGDLAVSIRPIRHVVVLDAGHGGKDPGAQSVSGLHEKDFNLTMIQKIAALLQKEPALDVRLTRNDDTFLELNERTAFANELQADVFVSIHANKFSKPSVNGVETYYTREDSSALAELLHRNILAATGSADRNVRTADFRVTKYTEMPAVLCEIGYLSSPLDEQKLFNADIQDQVAASIAAAIKEYLQIP